MKVEPLDRAHSGLKNPVRRRTRLLLPGRKGTTTISRFSKQTAVIITAWYSEPLSDSRPVQIREYKSTHLNFLQCTYTGKCFLALPACDYKPGRSMLIQGGHSRATMSRRTILFATFHSQVPTVEPMLLIKPHLSFPAHPNDANQPTSQRDTPSFAQTDQPRERQRCKKRER